MGEVEESAEDHEEVGGAPWGFCIFFRVRLISCGEMSAVAQLQSRTSSADAIAYSVRGLLRCLQIQEMLLGLVEG